MAAVSFPLSSKPLFISVAVTKIKTADESDISYKFCLLDLDKMKHKSTVEDLAAICLETYSVSMSRINPQESVTFGEKESLSKVLNHWYQTYSGTVGGRPIQWIAEQASRVATLLYDEWECPQMDSNKALVGKQIPHMITCISTSRSEISKILRKEMRGGNKFGSVYDIEQLIRKASNVFWVGDTRVPDNEAIHQGIEYGILQQICISASYAQPHDLSLHLAVKDSDSNFRYIETHTDASLIKSFS